MKTVVSLNDQRFACSGCALLSRYPNGFWDRPKDRLLGSFTFSPLLLRLQPSRLVALLECSLFGVRNVHLMADHDALIHRLVVARQNLFLALTVRADALGSATTTNLSLGGYRSELVAIGGRTARLAFKLVVPEFFVGFAAVRRKAVAVGQSPGF